MCDERPIDPVSEPQTNSCQCRLRGMVTVASSDSNAMSYNEYYAQYQQPAGLSSYASSYPEPASAYPTPQQYAGAQTAAGKGGGGESWGYEIPDVCALRFMY